MSQVNIVRDRNYSHLATFLLDANYVRLFLSVFLFKKAALEMFFIPVITILQENIQENTQLYTIFCSRNIQVIRNRVYFKQH